MASRQANPPARTALARFFAILLASMLVLLPTVIPAQGAENLRKYAGIVVDAKSGKVLYESAADSKRYPASVTKVMTLYVLFQELAAGNLSLKTKMTVSAHAASAVPTKLGLRKGSTITVENAIKSLVTLSANDMARVIAEHISGSESKFAERMTATAKALGMNRTTYRNASGLPNSAQTTTVRDQAILGIAIYQHFPTYYKYFQTKSFSYNGKTYGNHNRLLGENGIDGIKTGYINAAGSNLLTAARKDNRHVVVVAFGFNSGSARDAKVRALVREYLSKGRRGDYLQTAQIPLPGRQGNGQVMVAQSASPVFVQPMPLPSFRMAAVEQPQQLQAAPEVVIAEREPTDAPRLSGNVEQNVVVAAANTQPTLAPADIGIQPALEAANIMGGQLAPEPRERPDVIGAWQGETYTLGLGAPPAELGRTMPSAPLLPPVEIGTEGQPVDLMTSGSIGPAAQTVAAVDTSSSATLQQPTESWVVQVGAAPDETGAQSLLATAAKKVTLLGDYRSYVERFEKDGQVFFRARFTGFPGRGAAADICSELKRAEMSCLAVQS